MEKEYCIFKKTGEFVFTSSVKPDNYIGNTDFIVLYVDKLDFRYTYSYENDKIVKGPKWEDILPPIE